MHKERVSISEAKTYHVGNMNTTTPSRKREKSQPGGEKKTVEKEGYRWKGRARRSESTPMIRKKNYASCSRKLHRVQMDMAVAPLSVSSGCEPDSVLAGCPTRRQDCFQTMSKCRVTIMNFFCHRAPTTGGKKSYISCLDSI